MKSLLVVGLLLLAGCGSAVPMGGQTAEDEQFTGALTARGLGYGPAEMRTSAGVDCSGMWQLDSQNAGSATFTCSDGRTGSVELSSGDAAGTMKGMLGGKPFTGTFERSPL